MKRIANILQIIKKVLVKIAKWTFAILLTAFILLQLEIVQTYIAQKLAQNLSEKIDHRIEIERVNIKWFDVAEIENVRIYDTTQNLLIDLESAKIDYQVKSLIWGDEVVIDYIEAIQPVVNMTWYKGSKTMNLNMFIVSIRNLLKPKKTKKKKRIKPIRILHGSVANGVYNFDNKNKELMTHSGFDHFHFKLDSIYGDIENLYIFKDTVQLKGNHIQAYYGHSDLKVNDLNTTFRYTKNSLEFHEIQTSVGSSYLSNELVFRYDSMADFQNFNKKVKIYADLDSTSISTQDLAVFAPGLKQIRDRWTGYGKLQGTVSDFESENFAFYFGRRSKIIGQLDLENLPNISETYMELDFKKSALYPYDLEKYLGSPNYVKTLKKFGKINFSSHFVGFPTNFTAYGNFDTRLGHIDSDLTFKIDEDAQQSFYDGELETKDFELGTFLNSTKFGKINFAGQVKGQGFTIDEAIINMDAKISSVEILDYNYSKIDIDGSLQNRYFSGKLDVKDPNLDLALNGRVNLKNNVNRIRAKALIRKADLYALKLTKDTAFLQTTLDVNFRGFDLDQVHGGGNFKNTYISYQGRELNLDLFKFNSKKTRDGIRTFNLDSDLFAFEGKGNFQFKQIYSDLKTLLDEYKLKVENSPKDINNYYNNKDTTAPHYNIDYHFNLFDLTPITDVFIPSLKISENTFVRGNFSNKNKSLLEIHSQFDSLHYKDICLKQNDIDIIAAKNRYTNEVNVYYCLSSQSQTFKQKPITKSFNLSGNWIKDALTFSSNLSATHDKNGYGINGNINFMKDSTVVSFYDSHFKIDNNNLKLIDTSRVGIKAKHISFSKIVMVDENMAKTHTISGQINPDKDHEVRLHLDQFDINYLSIFAGVDLRGKYSGDILFTDCYQNLTIASDFKLRDFGLYQGVFGDFAGSINWEQNNQKINIESSVKKDAIKFAQITGGVYTKKNHPAPLDLHLELNRIPIKLIEPYMADQISHMHGVATGSIDVMGNLKKPSFYGKPQIENGGFTIEYLKTHYTFADKVTFNRDTIGIKNIKLTDTLENTHAKINGFLTHQLFSKFKVNCSIDLNKTLIQNTQKEDNSMYFGKVFASGLINVFGPFEELVIKSPEITSEKGTQITIPLDQGTTLGNVDYVNFVKKEEVKNVYSIKENNNLDITGITIDLNMNLNEDAGINIIFDEKTGDKLTGTGTGLLRVLLDTKGDFNMYGNYEVKKGSYSFSMLNILNKSFSIEPGSNIYWNGNPYKGKMDLTAKYNVLTSVTPLLSNDSAFVASHPDVNRATPIDVYLKMNGNIMSPEIGFEININDYPNYIEVEQAVLGFESRIKYNEQELNKQVFSLIVLKKLSPLDDFTMNLSSTASTNVSEMFTNQLGYMLSQLDEDLDVYIDLGNLNGDNQNINVRLSYTVMDGRLRISHNGNYSNYQEDQQISNLFGEWTVEYSLSNDGKFRLKGYNKLNQNSVSTSLSQGENSTLYGVSVSYNDNFNSFGEFWDNLRNRVGKREDENSEEVKRSERLKNLGL